MSQNDPYRWRRVCDALVGALLMLAVTGWCAYAWEHSTGLTFATRSSRGRASTPAHLEQTRNTAVGLTVVAIPIALLYYGYYRAKLDPR